MLIYNGEKKSQKSFKLHYTQDAFSLGRFSEYYQADKEVTHYSSTNLEKYIDIVDMQHLQQTKDGVKVFQLQMQKATKIESILWSKS